MSDTADFLRGYYKYALPLAFIVALSEEITREDSQLNKLARSWFLDIGESAEMFMITAGGIRKAAKKE